MPLLNNAFSFSNNDLTLIRNKTNSQNFNHTDWSHDDLMQLRCQIRDFYRHEQGGICAYCKNSVSLISASNAHVEHIVPKSIYLKFIFEPKNLCVVCADCNQIKQSQEVMNEIHDPLSKIPFRYPRSSRAFKIVHPHFDEYDEHILIKGKIYIDLTKKGHFTIGACRLNRYFHEFGVDESFPDDNDLILIMNEFIHGKNSIQKLNALNALRSIFIES